MTISNIRRDKSFADDLNTERGIVSSRVALLLRSAEIKPLFQRFVLFLGKRTFQISFPLWELLRAVIIKDLREVLFFFKSASDVEGRL
jgi:hypothetical protein